MFGAVLLVLGFGYWATFIVGALIGESGAYHRLYIEEREAIEPILDRNPAFARVVILERSDGGVQLSGHVSSRADLELLRAEIARAVGERRAEFAVWMVQVE